jgi:serine/threonine protein kinase
MAPEQLRGEDVDPAWDLWALAVMAYEMLTGRYPVPAVFGAEAGGNQAQPPGHALAFFLHALSMNPARRPSSAAEFFDGLERALRPDK